jgi:hypothetical protein
MWPELGEVTATLPRNKRLEQLAGLVTHQENGRFARTIVNRLWERLMGRGIVHPVDIMANKPWSEELLDYLAVYLVDHHYDLKQTIEHITSSRAYQSRSVSTASEISGDDFVFTGPEVKRMTAEEFLDAIWMITQTAPVKINAPIKRPGADPATPPERQFVRASLVQANLLMRSLGRPNREQVVTTRPNVLSTLQALDLANGQILYDTLAQGAMNIMKASPQLKRFDLADSLYHKALCRRPTFDEYLTASEILGENVTAESLEDLLWSIFMLPEFQLIR